MNRTYETIVPDSARAIACYASVIGAGVFDLRTVDADALLGYFNGGSAIDLTTAVGGVLGRIDSGTWAADWRMHESVRCDARAKVTDAIICGAVESTFDSVAEVNR